MMQMEHSGRGPLWRSWPPTARSTRPPQPSDPGKYRWISRHWEISVNITTLPANISPKTSRSSKSPAELEIFPPASPVLAFPMVDDDDSHKSIFFTFLLAKVASHSVATKTIKSKSFLAIFLLDEPPPPLLPGRSVAVCLKLRFLAGWNRFCLLWYKVCCVSKAGSCFEAPWRLFEVWPQVSLDRRSPCYLPS